MESRINGFLKIGLRMVLLVMVFCLPVPVRAMQALARVTHAAARAAGRAVRSTTQVSQRALSSTAQPARQASSFARANLGKAGFIAGGLAGTIGANQVLAQEQEASKENGRGAVTKIHLENDKETKLYLEYELGEPEVCDLRDKEQVKKWWIKYRNDPNPWPGRYIVEYIEKYANKDWIAHWKAELLEEQKRRERQIALQIALEQEQMRAAMRDPIEGMEMHLGKKVIKLRYASGDLRQCDLNDQEQTKQWWMKHVSRPGQNVTRWPNQKVIERIEQYADPEWIKKWKALSEEELKKEMELAQASWGLVSIPSLVKKMVDRAQAEKEERERQDKFLGLNSSELKIAGVIAAGVALMGAGFWGNLNVPAEAKPASVAAESLVLQPLQSQQLQQVWRDTKLVMQERADLIADIRKFNSASDTQVQKKLRNELMLKWHPDKQAQDFDAAKRYNEYFKAWQAKSVVGLDTTLAEMGYKTN